MQDVRNIDTTQETCPTVNHEEDVAGTRRHELDYTDHTDHTDQEPMYL